MILLFLRLQCIQILHRFLFVLLRFLVEFQISFVILHSPGFLPPCFFLLPFESFLQHLNASFFLFHHNLSRFLYLLLTSSCLLFGLLQTAICVFQILLDLLYPCFILLYSQLISSMS
ncbi:hypothetical protein M758_9G084100, partial [Ceratodon purpureus]